MSRQLRTRGGKVNSIHFSKTRIIRHHQGQAAGEQKARQLFLKNSYGRIQLSHKSEPKAGPSRLVTTDSGPRPLQSKDFNRPTREGFQSLFGKSKTPIRPNPTPEVPGRLNFLGDPNERAKESGKSHFNIHIDRRPPTHRPDLQPTHPHQKVKSKTTSSIMADEEMPTERRTGASGSASGNTQGIVMPSEPIWRALEMKEGHIGCERKFSFCFIGGPQPVTNWKGEAGHLGGYQTTQQWYYLPVNFMAMYMNRELNDIIRQASAWRVNNVGMQIHQITAHPIVWKEELTTPHFEATGNTTCDIDIFKAGHRVPSRWKYVGHNYDGTDSNSDISSNASLRAMFDQAETGRPTPLPGIAFRTPDSDDAQLGSWGALYGKPLAAWENYPFNRYMETVHPGQISMDVEVPFIKGWRCGALTQVQGGRAFAHDVQDPTWTSGLVAPNPGVVNGNLMRPVTISFPGAPNACEPHADFVGMDPKEPEWGYRRMVDGVQSHQQVMGDHMFMKVKTPHIRGTQVQSAYYVCQIDVKTWGQFEFRLSDNFPNNNDQFNSGDNSMLERYNSSEYYPKTEYTYAGGK